MMKVSAALVAATMGLFVGCGGDDDEDTDSDGGAEACTVSESGDSVTIECPDGTEVSFDTTQSGGGDGDGAGGSSGGSSCSVAADADGNAVISCDDGSEVVVPSPSCTAETQDGVTELTCGDSTVSVRTCDDGSLRCDDSTVMMCGDDGWEATETCTDQEVCSAAEGGCVPANGSVRLESGGSEGMVQIYYSGTWGTICDDSFDDDDLGAEVVCKMLGFTTGVHVEADGGPIILDEVVCDGSEDAILDCENDGWFQHDCSNSEAVGVSCSGWLGMGGGPGAN